MPTAAHLILAQPDQPEAADGPRESDAGYELFRRALGERDEQAWTAVYAQYRGMVLSWVRQHPAARFDGDDDYLVNRAFERLWTAVGPERFAGFPALPAVLRYLKLCVHSVILDERRAERLERGLMAPAGLEAVNAPGPHDVARDVLDQESGRALLRAMAEEAEGEAERQVLVLSFVRDLRPREVFAVRPDLFPTVGDVYRVKRNLIERLRSSPTIRRFALQPAAVPV
jgi:DNA-directed RNA polymerase specialized sigma24 family protein